MNRSEILSPQRKKYESAAPMVIGSIAVVALTFTGIGILVNLLLIPILYALPIIKMKPKLLCIPTAIFAIPCLVLFGLGFPLLLALAIAFIPAVPGVVAGILINMFRRKTGRRLAIVRVAGALVISIPLLVAVNYLFIGNPVGSFFAQRRITAYVNDNFTDFDFVVGFPRFRLSKVGYSYSATVRARDNADIYFTVRHSSQYWTPFIANYSNVIRHLVSQVIEDRFTVSQSGSSRTPEFTINIWLDVDSFDPYAILDLAMATRDIIVLNEIPMHFYNMYFVSDYKEMRLLHLREWHINDELISVIERIHESFGYSGQVILGGSRAISYRFRYIQ